MRQLASVCIALALCLMAARARAHAPLPRALALSPDGAGVAVVLPGFGLLLRTASRPGFVYACDALLGTPPSDLPAAVQYFADGSWLLGSSGGLHVFDADGCESTTSDVTLGRASVSAIAIHAASQRAYAIATNLGDGVWRSDDRGVHWQRSGSIEASDRVTALLIDPTDPARLYVSRADSAANTVLSVSGDAGASFQDFPQERALRLLAMQGPTRLWAVARALDNKGNRGFEILRADAVGGPWRSTLRVNYFGGFTITDNAEIWVGDEGGGVYHSVDAGESFAPVEAPRSISCLASAGDDVWACTPNLPAAPALNVRAVAASSFEPAISLADVDAQVMCPERNQRLDPCQAAWVEWQRDVIGRDPSLDPALEDAGTMRVDAAAPAAASTPVAGCSLSSGRSEHAAVSLWLYALVLCALARRRSRAL